MNFGCRPITDDVTKVKIILINNRSEGTFSCLRPVLLIGEGEYDL